MSATQRRAQIEGRRALIARHKQLRLLALRCTPTTTNQAANRQGSLSSSHDACQPDENAFECQDSRLAASRLSKPHEARQEFEKTTHAKGPAIKRDKIQEPDSRQRQQKDSGITTSDLIDALRTASGERPNIPCESHVSWWRQRRRPASKVAKTLFGRRRRNVKFIRWRRTKDCNSNGLSSSEARIAAHGELKLDVNCDCGRPHGGGRVPTLVEGRRKPASAARHRRRARRRSLLAMLLQILMGVALLMPNQTGDASPTQSDPRPTIYSGQVSFGLLLSAHSSPGSDLATAATESLASQLVTHSMTLATTEQPAFDSLEESTPSKLLLGNRVLLAANQSLDSDLRPEASEIDKEEAEEERQAASSHRPFRARNHERRQIFERQSQHQVRRQQQQQQQQLQKIASAKQQQQAALDASCGQVNPNALYAGMGAIWASHQANLVGDSQLAIGTYVYDSCNDLDVGQRQSVRIVSNLNAFQQTSCESPRGSPISLTIAHGDNQLRAIQLLTSFKVPVITTREHFALEDYQLLSQDQRNFLFSTAPSSRHLALGALKFSKRVVSRSTGSPKLPNQFYKMSSKNGLIVISRNLPAKFIAYLTDNIPLLVNYEMLHSSQPIDQIRSVGALESILINKSGTGSSTEATTSSSSESQISEVRVSGPRVASRSKRMTGDDSDGSSSSSDSDFSSDEQQQQQRSRMLSPTILMFITPSEAIDLVTRLRNDLAEVSRYYSLIVATREDISPALRTIFQRGGSRLCSGKAFYAISPKPDEVNEFSRYFRDTVQMDGESSDHPLICEYAKHVANSKTNVDLDDVSTESVIKAVWSAAAAFKMVYKRECQAAASAATGNIYMANSNSDGDSGTPAHHPHQRSSKHGRQSASSQTAYSSAGKSAHSECLTKMNKNMSNLVQRALRRLDVHINSTGLQALDGFRIKFDQSNELLTNKFSIKYINKECEITEIGQYSGLNQSKLNLDEATLIKSLESTLPDSWPVTSPPSATTRTAAVSESSATTSKAPSTPSSPDSTSAISDDSTSSDSSTSPDDGGSSPGSDDAAAKSKGDDDSEPTGSSLDNDKMPIITLESDSPKKKRSNAKPAKRERPTPLANKQQFAMSSGQSGRLVPLVNDFYSNTGTGGRQTTNGPSLPAREKSSAEATTPTPTMRKIKPFPNNGVGVALKEWLPRDETTTMSSNVMVSTTRVPRISENSTTRMASSTEATTASSITQAPQYSPLPESGGNTDLDMPAFKPVTTTQAPSSSSTTLPSNKRDSRARSLETAATSDDSDYVTLPSIVRHNTRELDNLQLEPQIQNASNHHRSLASDLLDDHRAPRLNYLADLNASPVPLSSTKSPLLQVNNENSIRLADLNQSLSSEQRSSSRSKFRSQLKWIYSSWFTMTILGANICGALLTLYVLTFLLIKNCDGSLDRENQGIRSMHLLAIIVVFFGSTLFIVYPTPGLCLLRTSWHNFALVLIFGSLLLQTMQARSISSLGLGGRPNRLNQFLTLLFMVGVQVSFELQRWKYESANYVNFVNQYFSSSENGDKKLMSMTISMVGSFNPLNPFNDQATPVSIQVSEKYQSLLHDYCSLPIEDFLQSQIYLWIIIGLLITFSITARRASPGNSGLMKGKLNPKPGASSSLTAPLAQSVDKITSGRLLASHHKANLLSNSALDRPFAPFGSNVMANGKLARRYRTIGNVFSVTLISTPIYLVSVMLHVHGQSFVNDDLISSVTMVLIAFTILIGTFLPVLRNVSRESNMHMSSSEADQATSLSKSAGPINSAIDSSQRRSYNSKNNNNKSSGLSNGSPGAFAMFPEFASTGLRRPSSIGGESGSHGASSGSRRPFAETKESRRQMGVSLANLPAPSADSLRSLCVYSHHQENHNRMSRMSEGGAYGRSASGVGHQLDPGLLNLKLNLGTLNDELGGQQMVAEHDYQQRSASSGRHQHNRGHHHKQHPGHKVAQSHRSLSSNEKRLVMLDVDPCCPRHGVGATEGWSHRHSAGGASCLDDGFASGSHLSGPT